MFISSFEKNVYIYVIFWSWSLCWLFCNLEGSRNS